MAGVDEVGRGCLAGPVVVAAVILPIGIELAGVRDSKLLSAKRRDSAFDSIRNAALAWAAFCVSAAEVDRLNVLWASLGGMTSVLGRLRIQPDLALIDGHMLPRDLKTPALALVKGDQRSQSIAAASIIAKVARDRLMRSWSKRYPEYGFERHVGYPTPEHKAALEQFGATPLHRQSFAPVAAVLRRAARN